MSTDLVVAVVVAAGIIHRRTVEGPRLEHLIQELI